MPLKAIPKKTIMIGGIQFYKGYGQPMEYDALRDRYRIKPHGSLKHLMVDREYFDQLFKKEEQP
jgi:hypothetical protein